MKLINDYKDLPQFGNGEQEDNQRIKLLTEENQVLFEQITLLRAHTDHILTDYGSKTEEATIKINRYD